MAASLSESQVRDMIVFVAEKIIESKPFLTELDSKIGDGDHGIGMAGGMRKARDRVLGQPASGNVFALFGEAGKAMIMSMGGASGIIFGSLYQAGAAEMGPRPELFPHDLAEMLEKSLAAIKIRGKAQVGDKTMVDALEPAVGAMKAAAPEGFVPMFAAGEEAASKGLESTKNFQAKFGRAKSLMERAVGFPDAGAASVWIMLRSMREFAETVFLSGDTPKDES